MRRSGALTIGGTEITPFGFSVVPFMILAGALLLYSFFSWERRVISRGGSPLMHPELLSRLQLRNGLSMLLAQQTVIGGMFFVVPIYLQYVLLQNSFETGLKLAPMSLAMLIAAFSGPKLAVKRSPTASPLSLAPPSNSWPKTSPARPPNSSTPTPSTSPAKPHCAPVAPSPCRV